MGKRLCVMVLGSMLFSVPASAATVRFTAVGGEPHIRKMAVCDGKFYAYFADGIVRSSTTGAARSFVPAFTPAGTGPMQDMTCSRGYLLYLNSQLYRVQGNTPTLVDAAPPVVHIAVGEGLKDDFPNLYGVDFRGALFRSASLGAARGWTPVGVGTILEFSAATNWNLIAVLRDGTLWTNDQGGANAGWTRNDVCNLDLRDVLSVAAVPAVDGSGKGLYVLKPDGTIYRGLFESAACNFQGPTQMPIPRPQL